MTTWAVGMVKDEEDVIEGCIRHLAAEVDGILIADNLSNDDTPTILRKLRDDVPCALIVVTDPEVAYHQSRKMTRLAESAAINHGATWIVPFDADELWVASGGRLRDVLADMVAPIVQATLFNHFATAIDPAGDDPFATMVWRQRQPGALPKVAFRWEPGATVAQGNHGVTLPSSSLTMSGALEVRHFPYRSPDQMVRKARNGAAAYRAATDLPESFGAHWRAYGELVDRYGDQALHDVFRQHFWHLSPVDGDMVLDPAQYRRWE